MDVLLVEDNPADTDLIREMLPESSSFRLSPVSRLSAALDSLEARGFEAILLDLGLPDSQGLDTLSSLRVATRGAPIIVSSGLSDEHTAIRALQLGAQDYVIKGRFDSQGLVRALRYAVARVEVERVLRESEKQYRELFDASPHPMWVFEPETLRFLEVNQAVLHGYGWSRDELLSTGVEAVVPEESRAELRAGAAAAFGGSPQLLGATRPWRHRTRSGDQIEVELALTRISFRGRPCLLAVATDVSENRRLQAQLLQASKMQALGQLAGGIAHDFNNALGVITGYAELIEADPKLSGVGRERIGRVLKASRQSSGLTRQLLAFSRREQTQPRAVSLNEIVAEFGEMLPQLIGETIDVSTTLAEDLGLVFADPVQLQQLLMNLAVNARDAMPTGGTLTIETSNVEVDARFAEAHPGARPGRYVRLRVADTGEGMTTETLEHLFEPFYTTKREGKGTGLGLATVVSVVERAQGVLDVASTLGKGTTFLVYLPESTAPVPRVEEAQPARGAADGETVLIVDDGQALRLMIREILEMGGYRVLEASGPEAALKLVAAHREHIHLLLSDVRMPGMSGPELAARLTRVRPSTRVLFMSGYAPSLPDAGSEPEVNGRMLEKPFSAQQLLEEVRRLLDAPDAPPSTS